MATFIANNKQEASRIITIKSNVIVGLLALTGFTDDSNDPVGTAKFIKTFRYSTNGVIFSDWIPLTLSAVTSIQLDPSDRFIIEISYAKDEPVGTSVLNVNEATLTGDVQPFDPKTYFDNSIFKRYFGFYDTEVLNWYINVLEKLWTKGLIPNYLTRDKNDPDDFLALFGAVAKFFAYYVKLARVFSTFYNRVDLLREFLEGRGLNTSPQDTLPQLQEMLETFYYQMSKRGTIKILDPLDVFTIAGELRRLIHQQVQDEFIFCLYEPQNFGWTLDCSSPLFKGLSINDNINKVPWSKGYTSMENAAPFIIGTGSIITEGNSEVLSVNGGGIGSIDPVIVDPHLDYEFSFLIKMNPGSTFTFNISGEDKDGNVVNLLSRKDGSTVTAFFQDAVLMRGDIYLPVKCYLYNYDRGQFTGDSINIRQGNNIITDQNLNKIYFSVECTGEAIIKDFKLVPMQTEYERGFLQVKNFISIWLFNRNNQYSLQELELYVARYLTNYNSDIKITNIGDYLYNALEEDIDQTIWIGSGEYCRKVVWIGIDPACEQNTLVWVPDEDTAYCEQTT